MSKVITVILQFEQESAFTVARAPFRTHFTDQIRAMNGNPNLGKLRSAHMALADNMASISSMDASAYGTPTASLPKTWQRCAACTNDLVCRMAGGCIAAQKAVDKAAKTLGMDRKVVITGQSGLTTEVKDLFPADEPLPPRRKKTVVKKSVKKAPAKKGKRR